MFQNRPCGTALRCGRGEQDFLVAPGVGSFLWGWSLCSAVGQWSGTLHAYFLDRLVPVCAELLEAAAAAGEVVPDVEAYGLMRA